MTPMPDSSTPPQDIVDVWRASVRSAHDARVQAVLDRLSPREKALVREAAVMGFVQGVMHAGALFDVTIPKDSDTLYRVLVGITGLPATYPALSGWREDSDA